MHLQNGVTKIGGSITLLMIEELWQMMDRYFAELQNEGEKIWNDKNDPEYIKLQGVLRGMAITVSHFSGQFFPTPDDVVREVVARHAAISKRVPHSTPGLQQRLFAEPAWTLEVPARVIDTVTGHKGTLIQVKGDTGIVQFKEKNKITYGQAKEHELQQISDTEFLGYDPLNQATPVAAPTHGLSTAEVKTIQAALQSGMMDVSDLAAMFKVSEETIRKL